MSCPAALATLASWALVWSLVDPTKRFSVRVFIPPPWEAGSLRREREPGSSGRHA